jgi:Zn-dependent peptidase ImmA (M78 family)
MVQMKTMSVGEYAKKLGVSPQVIYQRIATVKLVEGRDWIKEKEERFLKRIIIQTGQVLQDNTKKLKK